LKLKEIKFQANTQSTAMLAEFHTSSVSQQLETCWVYEEECTTGLTMIGMNWNRSHPTSFPDLRF